ncbi:MAG: hypothetical protein UY09_C0033G0001, partial [Parcubacteria group bacterium GW2011_GWA2_47_8]
MKIVVIPGAQDFFFDKTSAWIITGNASSRQSVLGFFESLVKLTEFE